MASTGFEVVNTQSKERRRDESGDIIVEEVPYERITYSSSLISGPISLRVLNAFCGTGPACSCYEGLECSFTNCCCTPPTLIRRVYLTDKSIKIVFQVSSGALSFLCCLTSAAGSTVSTQSNVFPLTDIADIQVLGNAISAGYGKWGTELAEPKTIAMEIKPGRAREYFPCYLRCCNLPTVVHIYCEEGVSDFVSAVKRQMLTMARE